MAKTALFSRDRKAKIAAKIGGVAPERQNQIAKLLITKGDDLAERVGFELCQLL